MNTPRFFATLVLPMVLAWAGAAHANLVQLVTVNTNVISGLAGYAIAFSFQDGSGLVPGDSNNTATLSNFNFGGGSSAGSPVLLGGASGSLSAGVVLADSDFSSLFVQGFTPGASLSFILDLTTNADASLIPDFFGFGILFNGTPLPTLDDLGGDNLLYVNIDSASLAFGFATVAVSPVALDAPVLSAPPPPPPGPGQLPEPGSLPLLLAGLAGLFGVVRRGSLSAPS